MVYYIQANLISIIFGVIFFIQGRRTSSRNETSQIVLNVMSLMLVVSSIFDILAYTLRGVDYNALQFVNIMYFISFVIGTYAWFIYVLVTFKKTENVKKLILKSCAPAVLLILVISTNPLTNYFFSIDADNFYHRGDGVVLSWVVEWGYMLVAFIINLVAVIKEKSRQRREMYIGYLLFVIPMAVAAICQMAFYGVTTTTTGYMFSILLLILNNQAYQDHQDVLTGLKNKNSLLLYKDTLFETEFARDISIFVIDADKFKFINDTYGHIKGDLALKDIASALQETVDEFPSSGVKAFRFGGDEFVIIGIKLSSADISSIKEKIYTKIAKANEDNKAKGEQYHLQVSIGAVSGICSKKSEFEALMKQADEAMYQNKKDRRT